MQAGGDSDAGERLLLLEALSDEPEHRHAGLGPFDLQPARLGQLDVFHVKVHGSSMPHSYSRKKGTDDESVPLVPSILLERVTARLLAAAAWPCRSSPR